MVEAAVVAVQVQEDASSEGLCHEAAAAEVVGQHLAAVAAVVLGLDTGCSDGNGDTC